MQLTTHGSRYGLLLDDGVELVGDGSGMSLAECELWAEKIENEANHARSADPLPTKGCRRLAGLFNPWSE
jgi:hypothetical protein